MRRPSLPCLVVLAAALLPASCSSRDKRSELEGELFLPEVGHDIVVAGERFRTAASVVLWTDTYGYDATSAELHFEQPSARTEHPEPGTLRYQPGRWNRAGENLVPARSEDLLRLQGVVDLLVLHYDASGVSRRCFQLLHDRRGLSSHFMIDIDGTVYQTMDLRDTAWHAAKANARSIGIELANIGAYRLEDGPGMGAMESWYTQDAFGTRIVLPPDLGRGGVLTGGFVGRPTRPYPARGVVQGELLVQYDFTPEQYDALVQLTATLCRVFPKLRAEAPRDDTGRVLTHVLDEQDQARFPGIVGHYHVSAEERDPGPVLQWDLYLSRVHTRMAVGQ